MNRAALITGSSGGIGQALVKRFATEGYRVIALDRSNPARSQGEVFLSADLFRLCHDHDYRTALTAEIAHFLPDGKLQVLVNNAALQVVCPTETMDLGDWHRVMDINVTAAFVLVQALFPLLAAARGTVINISSIHAHITKPGFVAYATSKAALTGLTKALAVDVGDRIRVNAIAPAAIETPMLAEGFKGVPGALEKLKKFHPTGTIGSADEVAELALQIASPQFAFLNGSVIGLDGGIASRLHDPG